MYFIFLFDHKFHDKNKYSHEINKVTKALFEFVIVYNITQIVPNKDTAEWYQGESGKEHPIDGYVKSVAQKEPEERFEGNDNQWGPYRNFHFDFGQND